MKNKKISIIVPIYNSEKYLKECLDHLINQTYKNIQIVLVNDGSTDNSLSICEEYKKSDDRIILINQENRGVSSARNNGMKNADGNYLIFVDSDDYCELDMCENIISKMSENKFVVFGLRKIYKDKIENKLLNERLTMKNLKNKIFTSSAVGGYICNKVFIRQIIEEKKLYFDEKIYLCEDLLFISEYLNYIDKVCYINKALYNYRMRKSSASSNFFNKKSLSIFNVYETLIERNNNDKEICLFLKYNYILVFHKLKTFIPKLERNNVKFIDEEKFILKSLKLNLKQMLKFFCIKYFNKLYKIFKVVKDRKNKLFE